MKSLPVITSFSEFCLSLGCPQQGVCGKGEVGKNILRLQFRIMKMTSIITEQSSVIPIFAKCTFAWKGNWLNVLETFSAQDYVESYTFKLSEKCLTLWKTLLPAVTRVVCVCAQACRINTYHKSVLSYLFWNQEHQLFLSHVVVGFERNEDSFVRFMTFSKQIAYAW